ncbi:MAG: FAD binding domain-containing protein [Acidiferrobacteraceae bacterium]
MEPFHYHRARDVQDALYALHAAPSAMLLAGGTNVVDMMRLGILAPTTLIDISGLPLRGISEDDAGGVHIGALATNAEVAWHPLIHGRYPAVSQALMQGASPQVRNMASIAGNLLQRTRCAYFRDPAARCNKRAPGTGCDARSGHHRMHALFGTSDACIAANPSDLAVALLAQDAVLVVSGPHRTRVLPLSDLYVLPDHAPDRETVLAHDEMIVEVRLPPPPPGARGVYIKARDRASFEFALASVACEVALEKGQITHARLALGGMGTRPWRRRASEELLIGRAPEPSVFERVADLLLEGPDPLPGNAFKLPLARRLIVRALGECSGLGGSPRG